MLNSQYGVQFHYFTSIFLALIAKNCIIVKSKCSCFDTNFGIHFIQKIGWRSVQGIFVWWSLEHSRLEPKYSEAPLTRPPPWGPAKNGLNNEADLIARPEYITMRYSRWKIGGLNSEAVWIWSDLRSEIYCRTCAKSVLVDSICTYFSSVCCVNVHFVFDLLLDLLFSYMFYKDLLLGERSGVWCRKLNMSCVNIKHLLCKYFVSAGYDGKKINDRSQRCVCGSFIFQAIVQRYLDMLISIN